TFHLSLTAGHFPYNNQEILVNETMARRLGFSSPEQILGHGFRWGQPTEPSMPIVGVLRDFNDGSLKEKIGPLVLMKGTGQYPLLAIKIDSVQKAVALKQVQEKFRQTYPESFFNANWFDEQIAGYYDTEAMTARLFRVFCLLAIFISCLGVYGLVAFMVVRKTREVGIRKVLGASVQSILFIFTREFTRLASIAFLLAVPAGIWIMNQWLKTFSYHVHIGWWIPVIAILLSMGIAWITIGIKALRAALSNPIASLRTE
ncbi:MAG TPA: FtsX-like permease family protein, partial [Puia sp.]|nr:FtsX-like permease family protein [Puia sp.]